MEPSFVQWLDRVGTLALFVAITLFVIVNGLFIAGIIVRRDRALVNTWTSRILAVDLALVALGLGVPAVSATARFGARMLMPEIRSTLPMPAAKELPAEALIKVPLRP